jgi:alanine dehydrogenase
MRIGVVKEILADERRVALTPIGAAILSSEGHEVLVESGAGTGSGLDDAQYRQAGARIVSGAEDVWERSALLVKVKEPREAEYEHLHPGLTVFCYLHLAANPTLANVLMASGATAIGYETIEDARHQLPLLAPMSEIAGRLAAQAGAYFLQAPVGGAGILMGGAPGVATAQVLVIGGGVVGTNSARVAAGMGAEVTVLEQSLDRIRALEAYFDGKARILKSDPTKLESLLPEVDLVIGAVLIPGARAPRLITRQALALLRPGSVLVDVAIDQGGCFETSRPTTHDAPVFDVRGVVHYCVTNMPGAVPVTATRALTNATIDYVRRLAALGPERAIAEDPGLEKGVNVRAGEITYLPVAQAVAESKVAA